MKKVYIYTILLLLLFLIQSCRTYRQLWYTNPLNAASQPYVAMPTFKDSSKSATYANINFYKGSANDYGSDEVNLFSLGIYRTKKINMFQLYYGGNFFIGNYVLHPLESDDMNYFQYKKIEYGNIYKTFSAAGVMGGINYTVQGKNSEWRVLGFEFTINKEFGNYLNFRESLSDSSTTLLIKNSGYTTLGLNTEVISYLRKGSLGMKFSYGYIIEKEYIKPKVYDIHNGNQRQSFNYLTLAISYTNKKYTGYIQSDFGIKASGTKVGFVYRLW